MLIIIDGPKGSGKTTISNLLVNYLNKNNHPAIYHKHLRNPEDEYNNMLRLICEDSNVIKVVDRLVWTEWVMGIYTNRLPSKELTRKCIALDKLIKIKEIPHLLLLPDNEVLRLRLKNRSEPSRQVVDMSWDLIQPLWNAAYGLSGMIKFSNDNISEQGLIINYILSQIGIKPHFTGE